MRLFSCALAGLTTLSLVGSAASAAVIHFDDFTSDSLAGSTYNTSNSRLRPTHAAASAGVPALTGPGNTVTAVNGRIARVAGTNGSALTLDASIGTFADAPGYSVSAFFRSNVSATGGNRGQMGGVGLSNLDNGFWSDATITPTAHSGFEVLVVGGNNTDVVDLRIRNISTGTIAGTTSATTATIQNQLWYEVKLDVTRNLDGTFDADAVLIQYDAGESGERAGWYNPTTLITVSADGLTNANIDATTNLFAGLGLRRNVVSSADLTGFGAADNFSVNSIPEPMALSVVALSGMLMLRRRSRA